MKKEFFILSITISINLLPMENKSTEIKKLRASSTSTLIEIAAIAEKEASHIYETWISKLMDNNNPQQVIDEINEHYKHLSPLILNEVKKKFVKKYANTLGSHTLRSMNIETGESIIIYYDQRSITTKNTNGVCDTICPEKDSPWKSYSFAHLISEFSKKRTAELVLMEQGKSYGSLWPTVKKPTKQLTKTEKKAKKRYSWHAEQIQSFFADD